MLVSVQRKTLKRHRRGGVCRSICAANASVIPYPESSARMRPYYGLLWVAVDLLQVLWETWRGGRDGGRWQQVPLLQQVDHSQGLRGAGLEAHGSQGRAQLGRTRTNRWLGGEGGGWRVNLAILHRHGSQLSTAQSATLVPPLTCWYG